MERFRDSRVVAFSTGCVYGKSNFALACAIETGPLLPTDAYSMSCVDRERIVEYFSRTVATRASISRLNYAVELRYGMLAGNAQMVLAEEPIDLTTGQLNVIWQGHASAMAIQSLEKVSSPAFVLNLVGPEFLSVRRIAENFGESMQKPVRFVGEESSSCLLTNGQLCHKLFGYPQAPVQTIIEWMADWVRVADSWQASRLSGARRRVLICMRPNGMYATERVVPPQLKAIRPDDV